MGNYVKLTGAETGKTYSIPADEFANNYDDIAKNSAGGKVEMYDMDGNKTSVDVGSAKDMYGKGYTYWQGQHNYHAGKIRAAEARKAAAEEKAAEEEPANAVSQAKQLVKPQKPAAETAKQEAPAPAAEAPKAAETVAAPKQEKKRQPLTEAEKMEMMYGSTMQNIAGTVAKTDRTLNKIKAQTDVAKKPIQADRKINLGENRKTIEKAAFNPNTGKVEKTYQDEYGNEFNNRADADLTGNLADQYNSKLNNIDAELSSAEADLEKLKSKREEARAARGKTIGILHHTPGSLSTQDETKYNLEDNAYNAAIRQAEERIKNIKEERDARNGEDVGFWRGVGRAVSDGRTWDFGIGDARDMSTMLQLQSEDGLTDSQKKARQAMMESLYKSQQTEQKYSGNRDFWYRAGTTTGMMPAFMVDFAAATLTGGSSAALKVGSKVAAKVATKALGEQMVESMAKKGIKAFAKEAAKDVLRQGAGKAAAKTAARDAAGKYTANWAIKALGTTADDLLVRAPLMTNTIQVNKTFADTVGRKLGDVTRDDNGNFSFENSKSWGDAAWQGEANAIIENYSEMFGAHLDPVMTLENTSKLASTFGAKRLSELLSKGSKAGIDSAMGQTKKLFEKVGVSDYVGEVSEEYYGQLWRTMLNLDDAYIENEDGSRTNNFLNAQFHGDILGGMALSMGLMSGAKAGFSAASYHQMKKNLRGYEADARVLLGDDKWDVIKATLQATTNDNIGNFIATIKNDKDLTEEDKTAVLKYTEGSMRLRGFDMGELKQKEDESQRQQWEQPNEQAANEAGQTIASQADVMGEQPNSDIVKQESQEYRDAQQALSEATTKMLPNIASLDTDGWLSDVDLAAVPTEELSKILPALAPQLRDAVTEYISIRNVANNAAIRHQAMLDGLSNSIDQAVEQYYAANMSNSDEGAAEVVQYTDEQGQAWFVRSGLNGESTLLTNENGEVKWVPTKDLDQTRMAGSDKESILDGMRTNLQEKITQEYGLAEAPQAEQQQAGQQPQNAPQQEEAAQQPTAQEGGQPIIEDQQKDEDFVFPQRVDENGKTVDDFTGEGVTPENAVERLRTSYGMSDEDIAAWASSWREGLPPQTVGMSNEALDALNRAKYISEGIVTTIMAPKVFGELDKQVGTVVSEQTTRGGKHIRGILKKEVRKDGLVVYSAPGVKDDGTEISKRYFPMPKGLHVSEESSINESFEDGAKILGVKEIRYSEGELPAATISVKYPDGTVEYYEVKLAFDNAATTQQETNGRNESTEQPQNATEQATEQPQALQIPTDKNGNKLYFEGSVAPKNAVDDILADLDNDMAATESAVNDELKKAKDTQKAVSKKKANGIAEAKAKKAEERAAAAHVDYWQSVADEISARKLTIRQAEELAAKEKAAKERAAAEANGQVPDWRHDTPTAARERGYRVSEGERYDRQGEVDGVVGRESKAVFTGKEGDTKTGNLMLVDINQVQESHKGDMKNPYHFIPEAQPKDRSSEASKTDTTVNAQPENFQPQLLTGDGVVYSESAPVINSRGEVIQGNGRVMTMREVYKNPESAAAYKAYLKEHAAEFGLTPEDVDKMEQPILVNRLDVNDDEAIRLGQFKATDLESGGSQRIEPKETIQKMGDWFSSFINKIFAGEEDASVAQLIDTNGLEVLKYMNSRGFISNTQMETAVKDGKLTAEGKNDIEKILKHRLFDGAPSELEKMFNNMPVKAQKAILATYLRDYNVPTQAAILEDLRASIMAFQELMQEENFKSATTYEGAKKAISDWLRQQNMFEGVANKDKFSNFALELAAREKTMSQKGLTDILNTYYDMVSESEHVGGDLFNAADTKVYTKAEAVKKLFNVNINESKNDGNELQGSDALAGDGRPSREGRQGSSGDAASGERNAQGTESPDSGRRTGRNGKEGTESVAEDDEAIKAIATELTERTGISVVTDEEAAQSALDDAVATDSNVKFHKVTDKKELEELEKGETVKVYRAMQVIDGKLYPPMAASVNGKLVESNDLGQWIRADENPDLAIPDVDPKTGKQKVDPKTGEFKWKFKLDKGGKDATGRKATSIPAAYNPYWHASRSPLNDQFKSAWIRPNIVIVECEVPVSELTSGYKAERAKDAVGEVDWKSGSVSGEVFKQTGRARKVILSRWCKPVRILSDAEVAQKAKEFIGEADVTIPENVITPKQRVEFEKAGLKIGAPEKGVSKTEQIAAALKAGLKVSNEVKEHRASAGSTVYGMDKMPKDLRMSPAVLTDQILNYHGDHISKLLDEVPEGSTVQYVSAHNGVWYFYRIDHDRNIILDDAVSADKDNYREYEQKIKEFYGIDGSAETIYSYVQEAGLETGASRNLHEYFLEGGNPRHTTVGERFNGLQGETRTENNRTTRRDVQQGPEEDKGAEIKYFRTKDGEVFGFTDGEKIYLDTKKMKKDTPLHEYAHLWCDALRRGNPEEWEHVKSLFDFVEGLKERIKEAYPELEGDALYEEMITTYSGEEGTKKLEETARKIAEEEGKTLTESSKAQGLIDKVKEALKTYWKGVADMLGIHYTSAEEVADKVLDDFAHGVDVRKVEAKKKAEPVVSERETYIKEHPLTAEKLDAARKAFAEAKKSGDESEIRRTRDELKQQLDEKYKAQHMGLVQRRNEITKEIGKAEAEKIDKPWSEMNGEERMAVAEKNPLTEGEIRTKTSEENQDLIEDAVDYINGNNGFAQQIAYLKIYDDVRNRHENAASDSRAEDGTQLDATSASSSEGLGLGGGRERRGIDRPVDNRTSEEVTPGKRESGKGGKDDSSLPAGEQGDIQSEGDTSGMVGVPSRGAESRGSGTTGKNGNAPQREGRKSGNRPAGTDAGRKPTAKQGTTWRGRTDAEIKQEAKEAKAGLKAALAEMMKRGKGQASISLIGLNQAQIEYMPELMKAVKRYGMSLIDQGIYEVKDWMKNIREGIGDDMKAIGFSDKDIDDFIEEMWYSKMPMDGETHTIAEWSSIYGKAKLREKLSAELEDKKKMQDDAEPIAVKVGDRANIEETLPFLLPQQQEDVLRAETQFFGEEHADRDHAYGKGYMFTNGTGTGKTYTGLGIAKRLVKQGKKRILFVTPSQQKVSDWIKDAGNLNLELRSLDDWAEERGTTATNESGEGCVITTFANFGANKKLLETEWDAVIYDESHRIMENKKGAETARSGQHYMITNRDEQHAFMRLREINGDYQKVKDAADRFEEARKKEVARIYKEYKESHPEATTPDIMRATQRMNPRHVNDFTPADASTFPKLGKSYKEYVQARDQYIQNVEPKLKEQAKKTWKNTKTVFLSATPFNTRENLDYAEGYLFKHPENDGRGMNGRTRFYLDHFGAAYKFRYHRLEQSTTNPEAVAKQEIAFSDYLQNVLGTMSGRIIDSPYDYSRDFPINAPDHAEDFNAAVQDAVHGRYLGSAYHKTIGDYNYGSALFETMKIATTVDRIKEHIDAGRKVVVFHRRVETKEPIKPPFAYMLELANHEISAMSPGEERDKYIKEVTEFRNKYSDLLEWEKTLDYSMPREQLAKAFGKDNVLYFSGKESSKNKDKAVKTFNDDNSGKNIIVIQEASGKEGISLHDTTGKHQRVCITLALPQSPITALQIEGRTYRIGNKSNAIFEYPLLGLNSELMLFGEKFNAQVSTTENLALGSQARNLRDSFARGVLEHSGVVPIDQQGVGGKEFDAPKEAGDTDPFDDAVLDYYSNQKLNKRNREGIDYFPTPEPLGFKMVEWANLGDGDTALEPSAGHGAIARYVPAANPLLSIEPSQSLFTKLQLKAGGLGRKFLNDTFENFDVMNKRDVVVMNPPFGTAGATAIVHLDKAFKHLDEGGRVVAIIPRGVTDKKFDKWYGEQKNAAMRAEIALPDIVFQQAGTKVVCRVVVVDKITDPALRSKAGYPDKIDLGGHYDKIEDFFEDLRNIEVPDRIIDNAFKMQKKARNTVKELKSLKGVRVDLDKRGISVSYNRWDQCSIVFDTDTDAEYTKNRMAREFVEFDKLSQSPNETEAAVADEMKKLACKLADMSEEEMQRYIDEKTSNGGVLYSTRKKNDVETNNVIDHAKQTLEQHKSYTQSVIDSLGGKGKVVSDASELDHTGKKALRQNKDMTGYYDPKTGEVVVYLPNCHSHVDVERTVQHEKIGHEGLRGLLGKDGHKKFLQKVYLGLDEADRHIINEKMMRNERLSLSDAIDEYLAEKAEVFNDSNRTLWQRVKDVWNDVMRGLGFKQSNTEKDIRTALWLSKNRLVGNGNSLEYRIRKAAFNAELKKYHPTEATSRDGYTYGTNKVDEDGDFMPQLLYRTKNMSDEEREAALENLTPEGRDCLRRYNERLANWKYAWREAHYDRLASVREMLDVILKPKKGEKIDSRYDIASKMEHLGSKNQQEQEKFQREHVTPILKKINELATFFDGKTPQERYHGFETYAYIKHALERNRTLFVRDAIKKMSESADPAIQAMAATAQADYDAERNRLLRELDKGNIDLWTFYNYLDSYIANNIASFDAAHNDMSGLSDPDSEIMKSLGISIGKKGEYDETAALNYVMDSESKMGKQNVDEIWSMLNEVSRGNVEREYNAGLINQKARDRMNSMFSWYLPLRGFDAKTSDEVYGYIGENDLHGFTANPKTKGRISQAETPISTLLAMPDYSIFRANKNDMKRSLVMLARDHRNDLVTEYETWYHETVDASGNKVLEPSYPELREDMTAAEIAQAIEDHEEAIKQRMDNGETWVKLKDKKTNSPYRIAKNHQRNQHIVSCMIDGKQVDILIHGNPRAAQAINGLVHDTRWGLQDTINHGLSQLMTSYSLSFMGRNKMRDLEYALASGLVENSKFGEQWNRNFAKMYAQLDFLNPLSTKGGKKKDVNGDYVDWQGDKANSTLKLFSLYRQGKLDLTNDVHRWFGEFVRNGGMTGYTQMNGRDDYEAQIQKTLAEYFDKKGGGKATRIVKMSGEKAGKFFHSYFDAVEKLNEAIENQTRFAAYCASRMERRSITRSVADAKEISINFNRTGGGWATHSLRAGNEGAMWKMNRDAAALTATYMRHTAWFYNAAIQGMVRNLKLFKDGDNLQRASFALNMIAIPLALCTAAQLSSMIVAGLTDGDDDKKKYGDVPFDQLPDYVRRQNLCLYMGHGRFVMIPLAVELRAAYGLMDVCHRAVRGIPSEKGYGSEMFEQLTQLTPYDIGGGSKVGTDGMLGSFAGIVTPSNLQALIACATNVKWTGGPVSGRSEYNSSDAEWQRGLSTTSPFYIQTARWLSTDFSNGLADAADALGAHETAVSWRGDDKGVKGGLVDINPAWAQYIVETYLGGPGKDFGEYSSYIQNKASDVQEYGWKSIFNEKGEADLTKTPIIKAFTRSATPNNAMTTNRSRWYTYNKEYNDEIKPWLKGYAKGGESLDYKMLMASKKGQIGRVVAAYAPIVKQLQAEKNAATTHEEREHAQWLMNDYISRAIDMIDEIEKK